MIDISLEYHVEISLKKSSLNFYENVCVKMPANVLYNDNVEVHYCTSNKSVCGEIMTYHEWT